MNEDLDKFVERIESRENKTEIVEYAKQLFLRSPVPTRPKVALEVFETCLNISEMVIGLSQEYINEEN